MLPANLDLIFEGLVLRIIDRDGNPWFLLVDLCRALGIGNARQVAARLDPDEKADVTLSDVRSGQRRRMTIVSEAAAMQIIMRSDAAIEPGTFAYRFRRWVTHEVLPSIRKFGVYPAPAVLDLPTAHLVAERGTMGERLLEEFSRIATKSDGFVTAEELGLCFMSKGRYLALRRGDGGVWGILTDRRKLEMLVGQGFDLRYIMHGIRSENEQALQLLSHARLAATEQRPLLGNTRSS